MPPVLHMIYGYLGSGKTTFAKKLEQEVRGVRLCTDGPMVRIFGPMPTEEEFKAFKIIADINFQLAERLLDLDIDVIMDHGFWSRESRDRARDMARQHGAIAKLYYLHAPEDVLRERVLKRSEKLDNETFFIDENAFEVLKEKFEPLGAEENHELVNTNI